MFRKHIALLTALILPSAFYLQACGTKGVEPTAITGAGTSTLGPQITAAACAGKGGDTDSDGVCNDDEKQLGPNCENNANCLDAEIPDGKVVNSDDPARSGWYYSTFGQIVTIAGTAAAAWAARGIVDGKGPFWPSTPVVTNPQLSKLANLEFGNMMSGAGSASITKQSGKRHLKISTMTTFDNISLVTQTAKMPLGKTVQLCMQGYFSFRGAFQATGSGAKVPIQLLMNPRKALQNINGVIGDIETLDKLCKDVEGVFVGIENLDKSYTIESIPPEAFGFLVSTLQSVVGINTGIEADKLAQDFARFSFFDDDSGVKSPLTYGMGSDMPSDIKLMMSSPSSNGDKLDALLGKDQQEGKTISFSASPR